MTRVDIQEARVVQNLMNHKTVCGVIPFKIQARKAHGRVRKALIAMALMWGAVLSSQHLSAQVPAVVASSQINLTSTGTVQAGRAVVDSCGNVYINQNGGPGGVVEIQAGTGKQIIISANTATYNGAPGIAIDSTKTHLYFQTQAQWYSDNFSVVAITNCAPGTPATFDNNVLETWPSPNTYYFGTTTDIAVDGAGDVFFIPSQLATGEIIEVLANNTAAIVQTSWPNYITSLAADGSGNLYFNDGTPNIYELKAPYTGTAAVFATGFTQLVGLSFDGQGNMYIADSGNPTATSAIPSAIYEIPLESSGLNPADQFKVVNASVTNSVAIDASQNIYVANGSGNLLEEKIGSAALPNTAFGQTSAGVPVNYVFNASVTPAKININSGTAVSVPFGNSGTGCAAGTTYTAGQSCSVPITFTPSAVGLQAGVVVLADASGAAINTVNISGVGLGAAATVDPGTVTQLGTTFKTPEGATIDSLGNLYVADAGSNTITEFAAGSTTGTAISTGSIALNGPSGVAVDAAGDLYIADTGNNRIVEIPVVNGVLSGANSLALNAALKSPSGIAFDGAGNLYIADSGNNRLLFVSNYNGALNFAGAQTFGTGLSAPSAVAIDPTGNVYVADSGNNGVVEFPAPLGSQVQVKVVAGLSSPSSLATDASGSLYVVDKGDASVFKYPNSGGTLGAKSLVGIGVDSPYGLTIDGGGNLYITDNVNGVVDQIARIQTALQFGGWNVGATSTPLTASIANSGNQGLTLPSPSYKTSGSTTAGFSVTNDGCGTAGAVAPGASCAVTVTFSPQVAELNAEEDLSLVSNSATGTPTIALIGTGAHITPSTLTLVLTSPASGTPLSVGVPVTFTATIGTGSNSAAPTGTIKFYVNGTQVASSKVVNAAATLSLPNGLPTGQAVLIDAVYSGDSINYSGGTGSLTESVTALPTTLALTLVAPYTNPASANDSSANAQGPSIPLTATLGFNGQIIPGGTVNFYSGSAANPTLIGIASVVASGGGFQATLNTTALRAGVTNVVENNSFLTDYSIFAVYSGDTSYGPSTSNSASVNIVAPPTCAVAQPEPTCKTTPTTGATFTISPASPSITATSSVPGGQASGSTVLTVTSFGGWSGALNFTCSNLPAYATCSPYPGAPQVNASTAAAPSALAQVQFIINTNVPPIVPTTSSMSWWVSGLLGFALLGVRRRMKQFGLTNICMLVGTGLLMAASIGGLIGCGNGGTTFVTPAGTTNVTVTVHAAQLDPTSTTGALLASDTNAGSFQIALTVK
jgi:sugar lactone lactonase YvrE